MKIFKLLFLLSTMLFGSITYASEYTVDIQFKDDFSEFDQEVFRLVGSVKQNTENKQVELDLKATDKVVKENKKSDFTWTVDVQTGIVYVQDNFSQIPNDKGTRFEIGEVTAFNYRLYLSTIYKNKHQVRLLFAPLKYQKTITPDRDIFFNGMNFLMGTETEATYKFNSYRLSYIYHFDAIGAVKFRLGFTGKIRDAQTAVMQNGQYSEFNNVGFVPLIHIGAKIVLSKKLFLDAEVEGSWAPQGYAFDNRILLGYQVNPNVAIGLGAGYLDGGADAGSVKTYAKIWTIHGRVIIDIF